MKILRTIATVTAITGYAVLSGCSGEQQKSGGNNDSVVAESMKKNNVLLKQYKLIASPTKMREAYNFYDEVLTDSTLLQKMKKKRYQAQKMNPRQNFLESLNELNRNLLRK